MQTGSGKTYTMMGDIDNMEGSLSEDCGITPRIFEYLFSRISKVDNYIKLLILSGESQVCADVFYADVCLYF